MGTTQPRKLFLLDGIGALVSAGLLGIVLVALEPVFGIPTSTLYFLAAIPCVFAMYDFYCYLKVDKNSGVFLKGIAFSNLLYCCLSIGMAFYHRAEITYLGWTYLFLEILIVGTLALIELRIAKNLG